MAALVLDASVALSWCFPGDPTEDTPYSRRILKELATRDAVVPEVWSFEIANGIFVSYSKRMRVTERQIADYLGLLMALRFASKPRPCGPMSTWNRWHAARILRLMTPPI
jgi:hypothetical protein